MLDPQTFFEALADPIRRRILAMLLEADELCVCDLHSSLDAPQPKVSRHLAVLRGANLVLADALPPASATAGLGAARSDAHARWDGE